MRVLVPLCWTLWGALLVVLLYGLVQVSTERTSSPEAGRALGVYTVVFLLVLLAGVGALLVLAMRKRSLGGLIVIAVVLAWPLVGMVAHPAIMAYKKHRWAAEEAAVGDFRDPALRAMADALRANDAAALRELLKGQAPPPGKDRAGNDLLAYAVFLVRDRKGRADMLRALLDAGGEPRKSRMAEGQDLVNFILLGATAEMAEPLRLLLEHGADVNAVDPQTGHTPIRNIHKEPALTRI